MTFMLHVMCMCRILNACACCILQACEIQVVGGCQGDKVLLCLAIVELGGLRLCVVCGWDPGETTWLV